jgi:cellulose synthase/poly-beta-1,6-N-acetylglucosamine synthase-like glycosyltransferase
MGIFILTVICFCAVGYTYVGYPLLLRLFASFKKPNAVFYSEQDELPGVSVLMAAYNEESVIGSKIASILKSKYPAGKIEVLIGSDNSTDGTDAIIQQYAASNSNIKLFRFPQRTGKTGIINDLVKSASHSILILTDANVMFDENTVFNLVRNFKNETVTLVDSRMMNTGISNKGISRQEKTYIQAEVYIKHYEGKLWGTMMGPFGGCYAMRKSAFLPVPTNFLVDDFFINMQVLINGGNCINEIGAIAYEDVGNNPAIEFKRKVRIASGSFQNLFRFFPVLFRPGALSFCFFSHKVLRWLGPVFMLIFFIGSIILRQQPVFYILMLLSAFVFTTPVIDYLFRKVFNIHLPFIKFFSHFTTANAAQLAGLWRYITGIRSGIWEPTVRNQ